MAETIAGSPLPPGPLSFLTLVDLQVEGVCTIGVDVGLCWCRVTRPHGPDGAIPGQQQALRQGGLTQAVQVTVCWHSCGKLNELVFEEKAAVEQQQQQADTGEAWVSMACCVALAAARLLCPTQDALAAAAAAATPPHKSWT